MTQTIRLEEVIPAASRILAGEIRGRMVVQI
jgi:hypothetical protein